MHDRYGKLLNVGDEVIIRGKVTSLSPSDTINLFCNMGFKADVNMGIDGPGNSPYTLSLNCGQVEKVGE